MTPNSISKYESMERSSAEDIRTQDVTATQQGMPW